MKVIVIDELHSMFLERVGSYVNVVVRGCGEEEVLLRISEGSMACLKTSIDEYYERGATGGQPIEPGQGEG